MDQTATMLRIALCRAGRPDLAQAIVDVIPFYNTTDAGFVSEGTLVIGFYQHPNLDVRSSAIRIMWEVDQILKELGIAELMHPELKFIGDPPSAN